MIRRIAEVKALNNKDTTKEENKLLFHQTTPLSIVRLFSSSLQIGSLLFAVAGDIHFPH